MTLLGQEKFHLAPDWRRHSVVSSRSDAGGQDARARATNRIIPESSEAVGHIPRAGGGGGDASQPGTGSPPTDAPLRIASPVVPLPCAAGFSTRPLFRSHCRLSAVRSVPLVSTNSTNLIVVTTPRFRTQGVSMFASSSQRRSVSAARRRLVVETLEDQDCARIPGNVPVRGRGQSVLRGGGGLQRRRQARPRHRQHSAATT